MYAEKTIRHLDLFSGIGGFALAAEWTWGSVEHTFVEYDPFCQAILKKHWPDSDIHADIREFVAHAQSRKQQQLAMEREPEQADALFAGTHILTGGFPCQPFSNAGRRKGTADDRYLWPAMHAAVALFKPRWVIAENVAGLASWNDGLVLETVCADLEKEGYDVQAFVIPAAAVGAPHRRDRIWIVAHAGRARRREDAGGALGDEGADEGRHAQGDHLALGEGADASADAGSGRRHGREEAQGGDVHGDGPNGRREEDTGVAAGQAANATHAHGVGQEGRALGRGVREGAAAPKERPRFDDGYNAWAEDWSAAAARLCAVDDGIPRGLVRPRGWRNAALKAAGNAIVPHVAARIMQAMKESDL